MRRRVIGLAAILAAVVLVVAPEHALAQKKPTKTVQGKLARVIPGQGLLLVDPMNQPIAVGVNAQTKLSVNGTIGPDKLQRGVFIQFTAQIDPMGVVQGQPKDLMIVQPNPADPLTHPQFASMAGPEGVPAGQLETFAVRGQVQSNRNGEIMVQAPGKVVRMTLPTSMRINVSVPNIGLASEGDQVKATGTEIPNGIMAQSVEITMGAGAGASQ